MSDDIIERAEFMSREVEHGDPFPFALVSDLVAALKAARSKVGRATPSPERLVISALSKVVLEESPLDSVLETVDTWRPTYNRLTDEELAAVHTYFGAAESGVGKR